MSQYIFNSIKQETQNRNTINDFYHAVKGNEKIFNEQNFHEKVRLCQQMLAGLPMLPIETGLYFTSQDDISLFLPATLRDAMLYVNKETRFDQLSCTAALLATVSIALCGRFRVSLKPSWEESVLLYTMLIAESGSQKDSLLNPLRYPLDQVMSEFHANYDNSAAKINLEREVKTKAFNLHLARDIKKNLQSLRRHSRSQ